MQPHRITVNESPRPGLSSAELAFRQLADAVSLMIWRSDTDRRCTYFNTEWRDFTGCSLEMELGLGWARRVRQDDYQRCLETFRAAHTTRVPFALDYHLRRHDGVYRWVLCNGVPFYEDGDFAGLVGCCVDISDQLDLRPTEARRRAVRELNHKLKNSLQTSVSFSAYGRRLSDRGAQTDLTGVTERLSRLALAHETLGSLEDGRGGSAYLELLSKAVHAAHARPDVPLVLDCGPVSLGSERASAVGRVVDELLSAALTHRFPARRRGTVRVASRTLEDGRIEISIADDGVAASRGPDGAALSFQRQLVERLVAHAGGIIRYELDGGTRCVITLNPE